GVQNGLNINQIAFSVLWEYRYFPIFTYDGILPALVENDMVVHGVKPRGHGSFVRGIKPTKPDRALVVVEVPKVIGFAAVCQARPRVPQSIVVVVVRRLYARQRFAGRRVNRMNEARPAIPRADALWH